MADNDLSAIECRIVGTLVEKQLSAPNSYPLSLNALVSACNQKSNREPVSSWGAARIDETLSLLVVKGWVTNTDAGGRVLKWMHRVDQRLDLDTAGLAVLCEMMLRGPQQPGELRGRASRMHPLSNQQALLEVLDALSRREPPLVHRIPRRGGERFDRFGQTLWEESAAEVEAAGPAEVPPEPPLSLPDAALMERLERLEAEVADLKRALEELGWTGSDAGRWDASSLRGP